MAIVCVTSSTAPAEKPLEIGPNKQLLVHDGRPIPDDSGEAAPAGGEFDDLRWRPAWKNRASLAVLRGRVIRRRVTLDHASVYAF
jgi:hypothetical protein